MTQYRLRAPFLGFGQSGRKAAGNKRIPIATHAAIHRAVLRAREPDCQRQVLRVGWIGGEYRHDWNFKSAARECAARDTYMNLAQVFVKKKSARHLKQSVALVRGRARSLTARRSS